MTDTSGEWFTAFAPASIGNVAVGFDMLGLAIAGAGDRVRARRVPENGVSILEIRDPDGAVHAELSTDPAKNTASVAAASLLRAADADGGFELVVEKGVPLQSGMGSSAASAVAGAFAANACLSAPFETEDLLEFAIAGEQIASGTVHADNVAPSLFGGLVLTPPELLPRTVQLNVPNTISSVVLHPNLIVNTAESRGRLKTSLTTEEWLAQQGYLAGFLAGMSKGDTELIAACCKDVIVEPQRASAVPCFHRVQAAAVRAGALGSSLSGSGPSIFALVENAHAQEVASEMESAARDAGYDCEVWISPMNAPGAALEVAQ